MITKCSNIIKDELLTVEGKLERTICLNQNDLTLQLKKFMFSNAKRIRPTLGILLSKAIFDDFSDLQADIATIGELAHGASLIHDDVIDEAQMRRQNPAFNFVYNDKVAVMAGDYILSLLTEKLIEVKNDEVFKLFCEAIKEMSLGEIKQYFSRFEILSVEKYIEKSKMKTGSLFLASVGGVILVRDKKYFELTKEFIENFSIAFQIKDDIKSFLKCDETKTNNDEEKGVYTLPVIFIKEGLSYKEAIEKSYRLSEDYVNKAIKSIDFIKNGAYKESILDLCEFVKGRCNV